jgi:hypothetical protein
MKYTNTVNTIIIKTDQEASAPAITKVIILEIV